MRARSGFTAIELVIVVTVLTIVVAATIYAAQFVRADRLQQILDEDPASVLEFRVESASIDSSNALIIICAVTNPTRYALSMPWGNLGVRFETKDGTKVASPLRIARPLPDVGDPLPPRWEAKRDHFAAGETRRYELKWGSGENSLLFEKVKIEPGVSLELIPFTADAFSGVT